MAESNFIDYVKIFIRSGKGGAGSAHFRREKFVPKGGPDGGDGGRGGHIIVRGNKNYWTLLHLKYQKHIFAKDGGNGSGALCKGADGDDRYIEVPLGTIVKNAETGEQICEVLNDGEEVIILRGGKGGLGNNHFKSPVNQSPKYAQPGEPGIEKWCIFELKVLADVGLVGFPNAGKSTLLSSITAAKPKIADYPFTTLVPNIGIVSYRDNKSFIMADIPGIIEGAHEGRGLGLRFLRHIERNSVLLFMIPVDSKDIKSEYNILLNELKQYNPELIGKRRLLAVTKCDMIDNIMIDELRKELKSLPVCFISSVSGFGIEELKDRLWNLLNE
jgi:GTP-binding protein